MKIFLVFADFRFFSDFGFFSPRIEQKRAEIPLLPFSLNLYLSATIDIMKYTANFSAVPIAQYLHTACILHCTCTQPVCACNTACVCTNCLLWAATFLESEIRNHKPELSASGKCSRIIFVKQNWVSVQVYCHFDSGNFKLFFFFFCCWLVENWLRAGLFQTGTSSLLPQH